MRKHHQFNVTPTIMTQTQNSRLISKNERETRWRSQWIQVRVADPLYLSHKGRLCSPHYHLPPWFFRPSYGPEQHKVSAKIPKWLASIWTLADVSNQRLSQGARTIHHSFQVDKWNEIGSDKASPEVNCAHCQLLFKFIDWFWSFGSLHNSFLEVSGKNNCRISVNSFRRNYSFLNF